MTKRRCLLVVLLAVLVLVAGCASDDVISIPPTDPPPTPTSAPPQPIDTALPTIPPEPTVAPELVMYFCGYDRCQDSGEYGQLLFETGITVWERPDPDRGERLRYVNNREAAVVVSSQRVSDGAGGLWYELKEGGWVNDLWLTEGRCSVYNIPDYTIESCWGGVLATEEPTAGVPEPVATDTPLPEATETAGPTATRIPTFTLRATPTAMPPTETATGTPLPTWTPEPTATPGIEVAAWVSNSEPLQNSDVTVFGRITRGGQGIAGVRMHTTWHYRYSAPDCEGTTGTDGQASCERDISTATRGYFVSITARFFHEGQTHTAETGFTPR